MIGSRIEAYFAYIMLLICNALGEPILETCKALRGSRHKVFRGITIKRITSTSWFYGLK
ncbi:hypothetical protein MIDIC_20024 [Alphaproteobacteria bacterium]